MLAFFSFSILDIVITSRFLLRLPDYTGRRSINILGRLMCGRRPSRCPRHGEVHSAIGGNILRKRQRKRERENHTRARGRVVKATLKRHLEDCEIARGLQRPAASRSLSLFPSRSLVSSPSSPLPRPRPLRPLPGICAICA
jgi:hypothetical protein